MTLPTVMLYCGDMDGDKDIDWDDVSAIGPYVTTSPASTSVSDVRDVNGNLLVKTSVNGGRTGPTTRQQ